MGLNKLLKTLNDYLSRDIKSDSARYEKLTEILEKLEAKKKKLEKKLHEAKGHSKKKRLKTDIKIVTLQLKKGYKRREKFKEKCK